MEKHTPEFGFTLVEVIAVLLLMAIFTSMAVVGMAGSNAEVVGQAEVIKAHLRFAQSRSMNTDVRFWGVQLDSATNTYWLFSCPADDTACNVGSASIRATLPGIPVDGENRMPLMANVRLSRQTTVVFDNFGTPYVWAGSIPTLSLQSPMRGDPDAALLAAGLSVSLTDQSGRGALIRIAPETGYVS